MIWKWERDGDGEALTAMDRGAEDVLTSRGTGEVSLTAFLVLLCADFLVVGPTWFFVWLAVDMCPHELDPGAAPSLLCSSTAARWVPGLPLAGALAGLVLVGVALVRRTDNWAPVFLGWALTGGGVIAAISIATA